mgnify:CR=1 FL=1
MQSKLKLKNSNQSSLKATIFSKIVVCAQSNVAVDVLMGRYIKSWGKFGFKSEEEVLTKVLRITSLEY